MHCSAQASEKITAWKELITQTIVNLFRKQEVCIRFIWRNWLHKFPTKSAAPRLGTPILRPKPQLKAGEVLPGVNDVIRPHLLYSLSILEGSGSAWCLVEACAAVERDVVFGVWNTTFFLSQCNENLTRNLDFFSSGPEKMETSSYCM